MRSHRRSTAVASRYRRVGARFGILIAELRGWREGGHRTIGAEQGRAVGLDDPHGLSVRRVVSRGLFASVSRICTHSKGLLVELIRF